MPCSIIIIDHEGEYKDFTSKSKMPNETKKFFDTFGIGDIKPKVFTLHDDMSKSKATLSLRGIEPAGLIYLLPELESRTENILRILINRVKRQFENEGKSYDIEDFRNRLLAENNNSQLIHISQRPAIARAILSPSLNLFDQEGKTALTPGCLLKSGGVSVIDCQGLDRNMRRVVSLYLLQMLDKFKMNRDNKEPGVLLVIDEAEELFPKSPSKAERDFVTRIEDKMTDIVQRGRKHRYAVVLVTHSPLAISPQVGDLTNTKIAFGLSGGDKWARQYFGKENVDEISELPTGICRIAVKIGNNQQDHLNLRVRIPYVGDKGEVEKKETNTK